MTKRLHDLGQKLGDDHDLAMLLAARADNPLPEPADWEMLEKAIASRRPRLQQTALRLASKALIRKPGAFGDFVAGSWDIALSSQDKVTKILLMKLTRFLARPETRNPTEPFLVL